ncbi:hypothetical protein MAR_014464 [Mya arenaria]|uniref:G-protein coupled receptors family 1 profile domain-containing protein n=1 Tax=Mya arenaria TaxID=6604 RepID=A0ABY7G2W3_MYAAR|nr:hypothetical protein MAR_014464 [Mya arenaria]
MESAMFLLDTNAMVPILERQYDISSDVVSQYGAYLNDFLTGYKRHLDGEVQLINNILISVAERQKLLLNTVISDMCNLAGGEECYKGVDLVTIALTSCNFLPLHTNLNTGLKSSLFLEAVQHELSPLVTNIRSILFGTIYLLLTCACMMIVCQIAARLPGQCSELQDMPHFSNENEKYENQSVIAESFESGRPPLVKQGSSSFDREHGDTRKKKLMSQHSQVSSSSLVSKFSSSPSRKRRTLSRQNSGFGLRRFPYKTLIWFILTVVFILTNIVSLVLAATDSGLAEKDPKSYAIYASFHRLYFINNIINPVVYFILDQHFRSVCRNIKPRLKARFSDCCKSI